MSTIRQTKTVYIAEPVYGDDGYTDEVTGYDNLVTYTNILVVPASAELEKDIALYGEDVTRTLKFVSRKEIVMNNLGDYGLWFTEPTPDVDELYHDPEYLTSPTTNFDRKWFFSAEKQ